MKKSRTNGKHHSTQPAGTEKVDSLPENCHWNALFHFHYNRSNRKLWLNGKFRWTPFTHSRFRLRTQTVRFNKDTKKCFVFARPDVNKKLSRKTRFYYIKAINRLMFIICPSGHKERVQVELTLPIFIHLLYSRLSGLDSEFLFMVLRALHSKRIIFSCPFSKLSTLNCVSKNFHFR